jgi:hypothetical protein
MNWKLLAISIAIIFFVRAFIQISFNQQNATGTIILYVHILDEESKTSWLNGLPIRLS